MQSSLNSKRRKSPYFSEREVKRKKQVKRSPFFARSPSTSTCTTVCSVSVAQEVGPLVQLLFGSVDLGLCSCSGRCGESSDKNADSFAHSPAECSYLQTLKKRIAEDEGREHFGHCSTFKSRWQASEMEQWCERSRTHKVTCWEIAEQRLHYAVRHLCPSSSCFRRAYAPYRSAYAVRSQCSVEKTEGDTATLELKSCPQKLVTPTPQDTTRVNEATPVQKCCLPRSLFGPILKSTEKIVSNGPSPQENDQPEANKTSPGGELLKTMLPLPTFHPVVASPYGLLEELFHDDPWKLLVSTILLNRTTRQQVDPVLFHLLQKWPSPEAMVAETQVERITNVLRPLGLQHRRTATLVRFSHDYIDLLASSNNRTAEKGGAGCCWQPHEVLRLFGCGEYALSAYQLFIQRKWWIQPDDTTLQLYARFQQEVHSWKQG